MTVFEREYHSPNQPGVSELPRKPQPCNVFPPNIRDALVAASQVSVFPPASPLARIVAIDKVIAHARRTNPYLFKPEN